MTQALPLVTIVIPAYNRERLLHEAVESALLQSYRPLQIVVVDDGSTDGTAAVARALIADHPGIVELVRRSNGGPGAARQSGADAARGELVQFLDSDDLLLPGKIRAQVAALQGDPEADIAYGRTLFEANGRRRHAPEFWSGAKQRELFPQVLLGRLWDTSNPLYRRSALQRIGPWAARCQLEDWEYDCRAARCQLKLHYCDMDVDVHRMHSDDQIHAAWQTDPRAMRDRIWAYEQVLEHALTAGIGLKQPEFRQFLRSVFLMARIAGSRGYVTEAERLFHVVRIHRGGSPFELATFGLMRRALGWKRATQMSELFRGWVRGER